MWWYGDNGDDENEHYDWTKNQIKMYLLMNLKLVLFFLIFFIFCKCINACKYILNNKVRNKYKRSCSWYIDSHILFFTYAFKFTFSFYILFFDEQYWSAGSLMLMMYYEKIVSVALSIYSIRSEIAREFETESRLWSGNVFSKTSDNTLIFTVSLETCQFCIVTQK